MRRPAPSNLILVLAMSLAAVACIVLSSLSTTTWVDWFTHPAQPRPQLTAQGAGLWRMMLRVTAAMLVIALAVWMRLSPNGSRLPDTSARSRKRLWGMVIIVVAALGIRATRISESLWYDEIASWMTYSAGAKTIGAVVGNFFDPINHPFHTLLNHLSVKWFADALGVEIAFRLPALIFSLLSVVAIFGLVRAAVGARAGFIAAGLTAALPVSVLEGAEARGYSMMILFSALATWLLIEARRRNQNWLWLGYSVVCALGIWSHFVMAFVPIGHGAWLAWRVVRFREWREAANGAAALALGAALTITLYSPMIPGMLAARRMFAAVSEAQPTILGAEGFHALLQLGGSWYWWAAIPGLALLTIGIVSIVRSSRERALGVELASIGLPLMVIVIALSGTWVYARFTFFALPGALLLIAIGIDALWKQRRSAAWIAMIVLAMASIGDLVMRPPKQPLRDAAEFVRAHRRPTDRLLVIGLAHPVVRVYADDLNLTYIFRHGEDLPRALTELDPDWIVVEYPMSIHSRAFEYLQRAGFEEAERFRGWVDWTNGDIIVYRRSSSERLPRQAASGGSIVSERDNWILPAGHHRGIDAKHQPHRGGDQK